MRPAMVVPAPVFAPPTVPPVTTPVLMPPAPRQPPMMDEDEPASKRSRTEENLIPEGIAVDNAADTHDLFGIQTRGGCACAGPFMQQLLGLSRDLVRRYEAVLVEDSRLDRVELRRGHSEHSQVGQ